MVVLLFDIEGEKKGFLSFSFNVCAFVSVACKNREKGREKAEKNEPKR
jgi:hypothetical protein